MKTKAEATAAAKRLLKLMKGKGWKIRVWENLGWRYSVKLGAMNVHPAGDGRFMALMSSWPGGYAGAGIWHVRKNFQKDPNRAVMIELKSAEDVVAGYQKVVDETRKAIDWRPRSPKAQKHKR